MNRKIQISYNWWDDENGKGEIPEQHLGQLEEHAEERIISMRREGYTAGELHCTICDNEDNEIEYSGWWEFKYVSNDTEE